MVIVPDRAAPVLALMLYDTVPLPDPLDPAVTARVMQLVRSGSGRDALADLSPQERRVLALIAEGKTNKEVGNDLGLTEKTVKNYLSTVFEKLHVSRRAEAAVIYVQEKGKS